jgi:hypothetical protein
MSGRSTHHTTFVIERLYRVPQALTPAHAVPAHRGDEVGRQEARRAEATMVYGATVDNAGAGMTLQIASPVTD